MDSDTPKTTPRPATPAAGESLRLLSFNIQAGIQSKRYRDYVSNSWKHVLPHLERQRNLANIGALLSGYDIVGLQEVDSGSLRSAFLHQTEYLAQLGGYPYWHSQINRELGMLARHSNGVLSRHKPASVTEHKLPGMPGRGAMLLEFPTSAGEPMAICVVHLALGWRARRRQLDYLTELMGRYRFAAMMGDFNCSSRSATLREVVARAGLQGLDRELKTFPSWQPRRNLDHILVTSALRITDTRVVDYPLSDHLPISMEIQLPAGVTVA
ncbi:endonuclease [Thiohalocapsa marina]|uniref:Endonuclease n=1 Tax=Thiohalocapsa marina TaxID=424902 RepID=A0A5M8FE67_9GAMM|nr:endonuclease/exonuclease/phosphatase family protein [Thiohalocapsa marina]KAA6182694.1 endonuclease [Thiohalocapsa marina]